MTNDDMVLHKLTYDIRALRRQINVLSKTFLELICEMDSKIIPTQGEGVSIGIDVQAFTKVYEKKFCDNFSKVTGIDYFLNVSNGNPVLTKYNRVGSPSQWNLLIKDEMQEKKDPKMEDKNEATGS